MEPRRQQCPHRTTVYTSGVGMKAGRARPNISKCVTAARKTAYSLPGAGLHGRNGLDPMTSMRVITLYVVPRLLHGLEATVLQKSDINELDKFKKLLRQIQHLPESTATEAIYLMLGALPIEAEIHARMLSLFGNITSLKKGDALKELARRQLAMSSSNPGSWFTHLEEIATTYEIDLHQAHQMPWPKNSWKSFCKNAVKCHWSNKMLTNTSQKSTLKHIVWNNWIEQAHGIWRVCREKPFLSEAASTRACTHSRRPNKHPSIKLEKAQGGRSQMSDVRRGSTGYPALLGIMPGDTCHPKRKNPRNKRPLQSRGEATATQSKWSVLGHHQRRILRHGWRNEWGFTAKPVQPNNTFEKWYRSTYIM